MVDSGEVKEEEVDGKLKDINYLEEAFQKARQSEAEDFAKKFLEAIFQ